MIERFYDICKVYSTLYTIKSKLQIVINFISGFNFKGLLPLWNKHEGFLKTSENVYWWPMMRLQNQM